MNVRSGVFGAPWRVGAALAGALLLAAGPALGAPAIGDRVSVEEGGSCCYDGTVIGVGGPGPVEGYLLIHHDNPSSLDAYARPDRVHPRGGGARATGNGAAGHTGGCQIMTIGNKPVCVPR